MSTLYIVDLVIFACLDFREFVILEFFYEVYIIRELSILKWNEMNRASRHLCAHIG